MTRKLSVTRVALGAASAVALLAVAMAPASQSGAAEEPVPGMAGIDTSLPPTASAVTVNGRGTFSDTDFTVSQTEDLTNQAISITWEGAPPTVSEPQTFQANFVQVMQCWGEPDDLVPTNAGPPPEQCVWGGLQATASTEVPGFATHLVTSRAFSNQDFPEFDPSVGTVDGSGDVYRDFVAVDGTVVKDHIDHTASGPFDQYWINPYFDSIKTNEVPGVRTLSDGRGQALFTVNTGVESSGLGCGQRVEPTTGGSNKVPRCWLVVVPRGTPEVENVGIPFLPSGGVASSPMSPQVWENRVAIELKFTPIDSPCDLGSDQRRINGSELMLGVVTSWQPVLCTQTGRLPYAYGVSSDGLARQQLLTEATGSAGMIAVNRPLAPDAAGPENPIVYAPLAASAVTIGFNVERIPVLGGTDDLRLRGVRYAEINLTPRLVAKLLTQSYRSQVEIGGSRPYEWDDGNPISIIYDPDFLRFNPEFALWQSGSTRNDGGFVLPAGTTDLASETWDWILADPEAAEWLAGEPDQFGMVVNPVYSTTAEENSTGFAFGSPTPDVFPKSDPYCFQAAALASGVVPPPLCALDWFPYASGFGEAAKLAAVANDGARIVGNITAGRPEDAWKRGTPQTLGRRTMLTLSDLPSASRFGLQTANLSRAGDNGADRQFIGPDADGMSRALSSMALDDGVLQLDQSDVASGGYPLTTLTYAALRPLALDAAAREDYAAFLDYAAGPGQVPGTELGQLPPGYLPLPAEIARATAAAAETVRTLKAPEPVPPPVGNGAGSPAAPLPSFTPFEASPFEASPFASTGGDVPLAAPTLTETSGTPGAAETPVVASQVTATTDVGTGRFVVAAVGVLMLLSGLGFLEITKRPRRRPSGVGPPLPPGPQP